MIRHHPTAYIHLIAYVPPALRMRSPIDLFSATHHTFSTPAYPAHSILHSALQSLGGVPWRFHYMLYTFWTFLSFSFTPAVYLSSNTKVGGSVISQLFGVRSLILGVFVEQFGIYTKCCWDIMEDWKAKATTLIGGHCGRFSFTKVLHGICQILAFLHVVMCR